MGKYTHWNAVILIGGREENTDFFDPELYAKRVQIACPRVSQRLVGLALLHATLPNGICVGPVKVCEEMTGYSRPTVTAALRHITAKGLIINEKIFKKQLGQKKYREYRSR